MSHNCVEKKVCEWWWTIALYKVLFRTDHGLTEEKHPDVSVSTPSPASSGQSVFGALYVFASSVCSTLSSLRKEISQHWTCLLKESVSELCPLGKDQSQPSRADLAIWR